jgi:CBS domain-containing protein
MTVATILAKKGTEVATIKPDSLIREAVAALAARRIGALVVADPPERMLGIVSERDIVKALSGHGPDVLERGIWSIMTTEVQTCGPHDSINDVMARMTRGRFRHLPVVACGRLAGIISIGDVVKIRIEQVEHEAEDMRTYIAQAGAGV